MDATARCRRGLPAARSANTTGADTVRHYVFQPRLARTARRLSSTMPGQPPDHFAKPAGVRWRATRQTPAPAWCRCWTSWPITERAGFAADERLERTSYPGE